MLFSLVGTASGLQAYLSVKSPVLDVAYINESNVIYNYVHTIWVPDQMFIDWNSAWR